MRTEGDWNKINLNETMTHDNGVTLFFECGCRVSYFVSSGRIIGGLACCQTHEAPRQQLENILPLKVIRVRYN